MLAKTKPRKVTVVVDVTQDDIAEGDRNNCKDCPIARATMRALRQSITDLIPTAAIQVTKEWIRLHECYTSGRGGYWGRRKNIALMYGTTNEPLHPDRDRIVGFIRAFDKGEHQWPSNGDRYVTPFSFTLDFILPDWAIVEAPSNAVDRPEDR